MCRKLVKLFAIGVFSVLLGLIEQYNTRALGSSDCAKDIHVVAVRGSGQAYGDSNEVDTFFEKLEELLQPMTVGKYELGSERGYKGYSYPAIKVNEEKLFTVGLGAQTSSGYGNAYGASVNAGVMELRAYLTDIVAFCDTATIVLGGYSQGAQVVGQTLLALPNVVANRITFAAMFGDPKLYLPEGKGVFPPACSNRQLSDWRRTVPNCQTDNGTLGARNPYTQDRYIGRVGLWCNARDWICGSSKNPLNNSGHGEYYQAGGAIDDAVREIVTKIKIQKGLLPDIPSSGLGFSTIVDPDERYYGPDVVYVVDRNGASELHLQARMAQVRQAAEKYWSYGGRIGVVTLCSTPLQPDPIIHIVGFTEDTEYGRGRLNYFINQNPYCGTTYSSDRVYAETKELALRAHNWREGAEKAMVLVTENTPQDPIDSVLTQRITRLAAEIDPVNIYAVVGDGPIEYLSRLTDATAGKVHSTAQVDDIPQVVGDVAGELIERPLVRFRSASYTVPANETIVLSVWTTLDEVDENRTYRWDFESDGIWDLETTVGHGAVAYDTPGEKLVHVEVTGSDGRRASMATTIYVTDAVAQVNVPMPTGLLVAEDNGSHALLRWDKSTSGNRLVLTLNGIVLGTLDADRTGIEVTNLERGDDIVLAIAEMAADGTIGNAASVVLRPTQRGLTTTDEIVNSDLQNNELMAKQTYGALRVYPGSESTLFADSQSALPTIKSGDQSLFMRGANNGATLREDTDDIIVVLGVAVAAVIGIPGVLFGMRRRQGIRFYGENIDSDSVD